MNKKKSLISTAILVSIVLLGPTLSRAGVEDGLVGAVLVIFGFPGPLSALLTLVAKLLAADGKDPETMSHLKDNVITEFMIWDELWRKENDRGI